MRKVIIILAFILVTAGIAHANEFLSQPDMNLSRASDGFIEGTVTLVGGTGNVEDVEIAANGETTNPDVNGDYSLPIQPGTYDVTASLAGYTPETITDVVVIEGMVTSNIDFTLNASTIEANIPLGTGWNWFSLNVYDADMTVNNVLSSLVNGLTIKSQTAYAQYVAGYGWIGSLTTISNLQSYRLETSAADNLVFEGMPFDETTPIPVVTGWNWISYLPQSSMSVTNALVSLDDNGVTIKSQTAYAQYVTGYGWIGSLVNMNPLDGYALQMSAGDDLIYPSAPIFKPDGNLSRTSDGWIEGTVTLSGGTGNVEDVEVTADGMTVYPDAYGDYSIQIEPGTYDVTATLLGYTSQTVYDVEVVEDQVTPDIDFTLDPYGPGWEVNPAAYEYNGNITSAVFMDGTQISGPDDLIGAFCGRECRGVAETLEFPPGSGDYIYFLTVYSNATSGDILTFKYWDAVENEIYDINETLEFIPDMVHGTPLDPFAMNISTGIDIDIALGFGWNWFSLNVFDADMSLDNVLASLENGLTIKSQTSYAQYVAGYGWIGSLTEISNLQSYRLEMSAADNLLFSGMPVDQTTPIPVVYGWNWVSYLPQSSMNVTDALVSLDDNGVTIKNQSTYAQYVTGYGWIGSLVNMVPLDGYALEMSAGDDLIYPAGPLFAPDGNLSKASDGFIEGTVTLVGGTGNVEDVEIAANGETTNPDVNGDYSLPIQPGTYDVTASLAGYTPETITDVVVIEGMVTSNIDFTLNASTIEANIPLGTGWNWFSLNVYDADMTVNNVLSSLVNGLTIKSQTAYAQYVAGYGWIGSLTTISNLQSYRLETSAADNLVFEGMPFDETTPIPVVTGWNWISYLPQSSMSVTNALVSLDDNGVTIKSQTAYAQYVTGYGWIGSLVNMNPLDGYALQMSAGDDLIYPAGPYYTKGDKDPGWEVNPAAFEYNGNITNAVFMDGTQIGALGDKVAAFCDGECRGVQTPIEFLGNYIFFLTVYSNATSGDMLTFKYWDSVADVEYDIDETLEFIPDMVHGDPLNPFQLTVSGEEDWEVNPAAYEYNGNITCQAYNEDGTIWANAAPDDKIGAFCEGVCRGVQTPIEFLGNYLFFLTVYSNNTSGDILNFKYWDVSSNLKYDITETLEFIPDMVHGDPLNPFQMHFTFGIEDPIDPDQFAISQNSPNPFSTSTAIQFSIPKPSHTKLEIYNLKGQFVKTVLDEYTDAGSHDITIQGENMKNGVYFYRLVTDDKEVIRKMVLLK